MKKRNINAYENWPSVTRCSFKAVDSASRRAVEAILIAIDQEKSIALKPDCRVVLYGQVGVPVEGSGFQTFDRIETSRIRTVRLERCFEREAQNCKSYVHVVVQTRHHEYLAFDIGQLESSLAQRLKESGAKLEDYSDLVESIEAPSEILHEKT